MSDEIKQLQNFIVDSDMIEFNGKKLTNVLPGNYLVLCHVVEEDTVSRNGNLFIIHEKFADENTPLHDYNWQLGGSFDYEDDPVFINNSGHNSNMLFNDIVNQLGDQMTDTVDNCVLFTMRFSDYGYKFDILKDGDQIIGINVCGIGSHINTPEVQLDNACRLGDLETVRLLLNHPEDDKRATLGYGAFYWACTESQTDIIEYLLSSPELTEHSKINNPDDNRFTTPFTILCHCNPDIVKKLIMTLPQEPFEDIKEFLNKPRSLQLNLELLLKTVEKRDLNISLENNYESKDDIIPTKKLKI